MTQQTGHINKALLPLSWLYGGVVSVRNKLFDWGIFRQEQFPGLPVICVGNLTVGGTGKTPHIEYLVRLLRPRTRVAVLSRGYKRESKGFILAGTTSTSRDIGDEPFQIKQKFPDITVAVDSNRRNGIRQLMALSAAERPEVVLLDDGFQHRWVKPTLSIVLSDNNRPIYEDALLPAGRLREPFGSLYRAGIVLVTKCSPEMKPIDMRITSNSFHLFAYQSLMFTAIRYGNLIPIRGSADASLPLDALRGKQLLLVTGIASPQPLVAELSRYADRVEHLPFADHHNFTEQDVDEICGRFGELPERNRLWVVTEKDAVRLRAMTLPEDLLEAAYYVPIEIEFLNEEEKILFDKKIINHVRKNTRNG